ncbi:heterokaryon incompatibility protein-domain-containing protein [Apodospora peruviana]|uniref:Heterokaryon incompatibility protein-domain-containing protein n=1 Tax=Apodospora peruviana TaxID=516989 RepID=A0AAE0I3T8_9PEZI|nr:heterokaryon incompatibility protein-domain-containing protein [Apodospora peruviana]
MGYHLCEKCVKHSKAEDMFSDRRWRVGDIRSTAEFCPYCALVWQSVSTLLSDDGVFPGEERSDDDSIQVWEPFGVEGGSSARRSVVYHSHKAGQGVELSVFRVPIEAPARRISRLSPLAPLRSARYQSPIPLEDDETALFLRKRVPTRFLLPGSTQSEASITQTKSWLKECLEAHHLKCSPLPGHQLRPTRLLHIRKSFLTYKVRLIEPRDKVDYLCLSHRWGAGPTNYTTTKANFSKRRAGIPWHTLPILFRHALEFTHRLGEEYIWIDSLCIIQDDETDWSQEAEKMAGIYSNSKLTLAAAWAENSHEDMFHSPMKRVMGLKVSGVEKFGITDDIYVRAMPPHQLERFQLLRRAWIYQERLLSPRFLLFSPTELIWECNTKVCCQCSGSDIVSERGIGETTEGRFAKASFWRGVDWDKENKTFNLKWKGFTWNMIVQEYSNYGITYRKDRLPAIAGMAKYYRRLGQDGEYLAGLWKNTFFENLLWHSTTRSASKARPAEWIAPTWSWASAAEGVRFFGQLWIGLEVIDRVKLVDARCESVHGDEMMKLKSGFVTICGPVFPAVLRLKEEEGKEEKTYVLEAEGVTPQTFDADYDFSVPGDFHIQPDSEVFGMEVANVTIYGDDGFGMHSVVLRKLASGKYERVGVAEWREDIRKVSDAAQVVEVTIV